MNRIGWILYCGLLTLGHLLYTLAFPSIINGERLIGTADKLLEPSYIHAFFLSRVNFGEFARRPLTTFLIQQLERLGVPLEYAFIAVLYGALFIALMLLYRLSLNVSGSALVAKLSTFLFTSSFWVIHAVFSEIYAYDEPVQYAFIFGAFLFLHQRKWIPFSILFLGALVARESSILLLPGIFFFFMLDKPIFSKDNILRTLKVGWTVPAYVVILYTIIEVKGLEEKSGSYMRDVRFKHLYYSFAELDIGIDTLTSLLMAFIVPLTLLILHRKFRTSNQGDGPWVKAMVFNAGINTLITLVFTMGRETRIFAQPVLLLSPWLGLYALTSGRGILERLSNIRLDWDGALRLITFLLLFLSIAFAASLFAYEVYWPTDTKFFSGFQHHVYLKICLCAAALMLAYIGVNGKTQSLKRGALLFLPFLLLIALFFGNQSGYRAYNTFDPVIENLETLELQSGNRPYLVVATNMPNVAENYFEARSQPCIAGDFNLQLPLKQVLYHDEVIKQGMLQYLELEPAINFPMRFILSQWGAVLKNTEQELLVDATKPAAIEEHQYSYQSAEQVFKKRASIDFKELVLEGEYSPAFKFSLEELGLDSLESFAGQVEYQIGMSNEAALVVTIDDGDQAMLWEHVFLNIFLTETDGWNTAFLAKSFDAPLSPQARISFYVWNPKQEKTLLRNIQFTLNSEYVSDPKKKRHVLSSRNLE